ncbi:MAG: type 4a pilus biogenesis protein PilO [Desulfatiglans sp.]|jgi:type IV pilus assembly protein PilO|nr:type 4a pilus biogenesis protein PilO [Desulfatiglans sp.]
MLPASFIEKIEKIKLVYRVLILVGTIVLFGSVFVFGYYIPKTKEIKKVEQEIEQLEQKIRQAKITMRNLAKFKAEQAKVNAQFQEALKLLPDKREIPTLLRTITQLGSDSNLEFRSFMPKSERSKDFFVEIPVSMEVSGTYHEVALFFYKVGRMERIVNITNVSMKPAGKSSTILNTKCEAITYRFKGMTDEKPGKKKKKKKKR